MRNQVLVLLCTVLLTFTTPASVARAGKTLRIKPHTGWTPACALYERGSAEWIVLGCWFGEPVPSPEG